MTYDTVLLATDGSDPATAAAEEAVTFAEAFDADLHAVYVLQTGEPSPDMDDPAARKGIDTKAEVALSEAAAVAAEHGLGEDRITTVGVRGPTVDTIVAYAEENDVDLIVMGTHARSGLDRLVIGSVAEGVVREAPVPVVTVRP